MNGFYQIWLSGIVAHVKRFAILYAVGAVALVAIVGFGMVAARLQDAAIQSHESKAQQAEDQALKYEGRADAAADQGAAIEVQRVEQARRVEDARQRVAAGKISLAQKRKEYDEAHNGMSSIDRSGDLSERERRLLAKLDQLYPGIDAIRSRTFDLKD